MLKKFESCLLPERVPLLIGMHARMELRVVIKSSHPAVKVTGRRLEVRETETNQQMGDRGTRRGKGFLQSRDLPRLVFVNSPRVASSDDSSKFWKMCTAVNGMSDAVRGW